MENKNLNLIMLIITILTFTNCNETKSISPYTYNATDDDVTIVNYNGCEYVRFDYSNMSWGGHSGTCKNKIHNK